MLGRRPTEDEYRALRDAVNAGTELDRDRAPRELLERPRDMMGRPFAPARETYVEAMDALFTTMMRRFVELNAHALRIGLDLLVFPQGTRSIRLSRGHIVYRLGEPLTPEDVADLAPKEPFVPFSRDAELRHRARFQALTDRIMERIDCLLDERHRFTDDRASDGTRGTDRFV